MSGQKTKICVSQPEGGTQTRPGETCVGKVRPIADWLSQLGLGGTSQPDRVMQDQPGLVWEK